MLLRLRIFRPQQQQQQLDLTMPGGYPPCNAYPETNLCSPSNAPPAEVHHWHVQQHFPIMPDMSQAYSQDAPSVCGIARSLGRDDLSSSQELSPLPLPEVHSTFADIVVGSSSPAVPDISLPSPQSVYHTPYSTIAELSPHLFSDTYTSPSSSYLPVPSPFNSPYVQVSPMGSSPRTYSSPGDTYPSGYQNLYPASPGDPYLSGYRNLYPASPSSMASPASFYSLNSPAMGSTSSFHSIAATTSPRAAIPYFPPASYEPSASEQLAPSAKRHRVPQAIKLSPKRNRSHKERFFSGGSPGVRVVDVLNGDVTLDGHDERVLEQTGHRQIRVTIQVSFRALGIPSPVLSVPVIRPAVAWVPREVV